MREMDLQRLFNVCKDVRDMLESITQKEYIKINLSVIHVEN